MLDRCKFYVQNEQLDNLTIKLTAFCTNSIELVKYRWPPIEFEFGITGRSILVVDFIACLCNYEFTINQSIYRTFLDMPIVFWASAVSPSSR